MSWNKKEGQQKDLLAEPNTVGTNVKYLGHDQDYWTRSNTCKNNL